MLKPKRVNISDFEIKNIANKRSEFIYDNDNYKIIITEGREVRQSYHLREIYVYKNGELFLKGVIEDVVGLNLNSDSNRYLFVPLYDKPMIYDLKSAKSIYLNMPFIKYNQFDESEQYLIAGTLHEYQIVNVFNGDVLVYEKNDMNISGVRFGYNNTFLTINYIDNKCVLIESNIINVNSKSENFPTPFEFFNIDIENYKVLQEPVDYNLIVSGVGRIKSTLLNKWAFVGSEGNRLICTTLVPTSNVIYSAENKPYCSAKYFYVEIEQE